MASSSLLSPSRLLLPLVAIVLALSFSEPSLSLFADAFSPSIEIIATSSKIIFSHAKKTSLARAIIAPTTLFGTPTIIGRARHIIHHTLVSRPATFTRTRTISTTKLKMTSSKRGGEQQQQQQQQQKATKIAIIGGGAAGLATARACLRANELLAKQQPQQHHTSSSTKPKLEVTIFESRDSIGGIWRYGNDGDDSNKKKKDRPMYRNLRTNLPKELMAYREFAWVLDDNNEEEEKNVPPPSYVTHRQVVEYLDQYSQHFGLEKYVRFGSKVTQLTVVSSDDDGSLSKGYYANANDIGFNGSDDEKKESTYNDKQSAKHNLWPPISLKWTTKSKDSNGNDILQTHQETFHHVTVCNGHYALPSSPPLTGIQHFQGRILHAIEYDDPNDFAGQTVVCIGARASGADIAREIGLVAKCVYLSDSSCNKLEEFGEGNVVKRVPRTNWVDNDGGIHFSNNNKHGEKKEQGEEWIAQNVDAIIFCSGYDYDFPFINDKSNVDLTFVAGERRVQPLYEQLWHARYPSLSFIGLPHSVVPFPLFELQANAVVSQLMLMEGAGGESDDNATDDATNGVSNGNGAIPLPPLKERMEKAEIDAASGGPDSPGRVQDTHFLGSHQWDYCRKMAKIGGVYDASMENYIATNKALYDKSGTERKQILPGAEDKYRETRFQRDDNNQTYKITFSAMESDKATAP